MDEWNNHSFIIWRTRKEGNTVMERRRRRRMRKMRGGVDRGGEKKRKDQGGGEYDEMNLNGSKGAEKRKS